MGIEHSPSNVCFGYAIMSNKTLKGTGLKPNMFEIISKKANYTPSYAIIFDARIYNFDVYFDINQLMMFSKLNCHLTTTFIESNQIIITTPGELYTPYEKLWLPFDDVTWMLLILTFFIATSTILIIYRVQKIVQEKFFGENVKTPMLNLVSTFFGISQNKLPLSHIPRFMLIFYIFFCLIFRTCYQSKLFEFMTSEPRRSPPKTMKDLYDKRFVLYWDININKLHDITADERKYW